LTLAIDAEDEVHDAGTGFLVSCLTGAFVGLRTRVREVTKTKITVIAGN
jgi:hypothetical protein